MDNEKITQLLEAKDLRKKLDERIVDLKEYLKDNCGENYLKNSRRHFPEEVSKQIVYF